jgi:hypothetical protein
MPFQFRKTDAGFDSYDEWVPARLPDPGPFLREHDVLTGRDHAAFHRLSRWLFEDRGVYDVTFGYTLARLDLDDRHPDAGIRYAREAPGVLRAEFTPTTPFCPQADSLARAADRAWNDLAHRHEYDRVRVRVHPMHQASDAVNDRLRAVDHTGRSDASTAGAEGP